MTGILDLPAELLGYLVTFLNDDDIFATRLANKAFESSSLSYFGKRFFRKKGFMVTTPSIQVLQSIAGHEEFRKYVQHVWFNPDCYTFVEPACSPAEYHSDSDDGETRIKRLIPQSSDGVRRWLAYQNCIQDHAGLLSSTKLTEDLMVAFKSFPNLAVVGMRRSEDHSPWGWQPLRDAVGEDPRILGPIPSGPQRCLSGPTKLYIAIMNAIAESDVAVQRLYTDAIEIDNVSEKAGVLEFDHLFAKAVAFEQLQHACRSLLYLEVNISKAWLKEPSRWSNEWISPEPDWDDGEGLIRLFKAAPHLHELGLQIFADPQQRWFARLRTGYSYKVFSRLIDHIELSHLRRLKLEKISATPNGLKAFMMPSKATLKSLKIRDVRLLSDQPEERPWQIFFEFLRDECPKLAYLLIYHIMDHSGTILFHQNPDTPASSNQPNGLSAGDEFFTDYENIAMEISGRLEVEAKLRVIVHRHWYRKPMFTYAMDETLWHTDTSDEEW